MAKEFLENLKKSVETGEFNSEAAKRIIDISKLAEEKKDADKLIEKRLEDAGIKIVSEEETELINSEYEKQMKLIEQKDLALAQLKNLIEIEDMVKASIQDMLSYVDELQHRFTKEFEEKDPIFAELLGKLNEINMKYNNSVINN